MTALQGSVVHRAVEVTTRVLREAGIGTHGNLAAVEALRRAGGISALVIESITYCLARYAQNPRVEDTIVAARTTLEGRVGEIRTQVQALIARLDFGPIPTTPRSPPSNQPSGLWQARRDAVRLGANTEVWLESQELGFRGVADLIFLSSDLCEIRDFKTGSPKEAHVSQLKAYHLLWLRDFDRNPSGRQVDRLVLSYASHDVPIPVPGLDESRALEENLRARLGSARNTLRAMPPPATPNADLCPKCPVRHLCQPYWDWSSHEVQPGGDGWFGDIEVLLSGRHGPTSWDATIESGTSGGVALVRLHQALDLRPGYTLRLLDVHLAPPPEDDPDVPLVVTMTASTEAFYRPSG